ncbi:protein-tyrosine phosphatase [Sorangium cellulosum]|uniref:Protein-tyrosine phosphatase n=1 Tax=Sorangium cellulosum TaxID=56 RepID=A0A4P2Q5N6_SORCE|nr:dual specificity protein phosphatase family protein [Sorangium cellulosum]AUX24283.1 protein-tyrosine phosphatase [Sorangium cellulosum]
MSDLENFSFVIPGELAGVAYPHAPRALEELVELGFRSVVSLSRRAPPPGALGPLLHLHCPLADFTRIPSLDLLRAVAFLGRAPSPIVVHGEGGVGRTGVVLACRLVSLGRSAAEAVAEVRRARPGSIDDPELEASVEAFELFYRGQHDHATLAPYNLAPASPLDRVVHGAERPGFGMALWSASGIRSSVSVPPRAGDAPDPSEAPVEAWLGFMARQGMREVLCLLDDDELSALRVPLISRYQREFLRVTHVPLEGGALPTRGAMERAIAALRRAEEGGAPVVVHCASGVGRAGVVLSAWLRARYGLDPDAAIATVREHARRFGARREPLQAGPPVRELLASVPAGG